MTARPQLGEQAQDRGQAAYSAKSTATGLGRADLHVVLAGGF
jgi:hypothetical protein